MRHTNSIVIVVAAILELAAGHGRFLDPPSRASMWRYGFKTPPNYNDNQLFCGGFSTQYGKNGGKCGVCGDKWDDEVRENEAGGKYATGIMVKRYQPGQIIQTKVEITANHKGWFQFKLCQNDDPTKKVDQACFDKHLLPNLTGETTLTISSMPGMFIHNLQLPAGVRCRACVLQWRYHTGNSWGKDPGAKMGCIGCGNQEEFYGCADIVIGYDDTPLGVKTGPQNIPPPSGPGDGQNGWTANSAGQSGQNKTDCNCPCAAGSALVVSPVHPLCWFICYTVAWFVFHV